MDNIKDRLVQFLKDKNLDPRFATTMEVGYVNSLRALLAIDEWLTTYPAPNNPDELRWLENLRKQYSKTILSECFAQGNILKKLRKFCGKYPQEKIINGVKKKFPRDSAFTKTLKKGHCSGFATFYSVAKWIGKKPQKNPQLPRDDDKFFMSVLKLLISWDPKKNKINNKKRKFTQEEVQSIERFLAHLVTFHENIGPLEIPQGELQDLLKVIGPKDFPPLEKVFCLGGRFTENETQNLVSELLSFIKKIPIDKRYVEILVGSHDHAVSIIVDENNLSFYDSNSYKGSVELEEKQRIACLLFTCFGFDSDKPSPLAFRLFAPKNTCRENLNCKLLLKNIKKDKVTLIDEKYCNGFSDFERAIRAGSAESFAYFLKKSPPKNKTPERLIALLNEAFMFKRIEIVALIFKYLSKRKVSNLKILENQVKYRIKELIRKGDISWIKMIFSFQKSLKLFAREEILGFLEIAVNNEHPELLSCLLSAFPPNMPFCNNDFFKLLEKTILAKRSPGKFLSNNLLRCELSQDQLKKLAHHAILMNNSDALRDLLNLKLNANKKITEYWTPLKLSISLENTNCVKVLLEHNAHLDKKISEDHLIFAAIKSKPEIFQLLLSRLQVEKEDAKKILQAALVEKKDEIIKIVLQNTGVVAEDFPVYSDLYLKIKTLVPKFVLLTPNNLFFHPPAAIETDNKSRLNLNN